MAHNLIRLLEGSTMDRLVLQDLQSMTHDGVDVQLIADILARAHRVLRQLGLDPSDTTAEEVYQALVNAVRSEQWLSLLDGTEYVLIEVDGEIISFNPFDVINNYHHELPLENRQTTAAKRGLGWEITRRFEEHPRTNTERVKQTVQRANWPTEEPQFCRIVFDKPSILTIGDIASEALITLAKQDVEVEGTKNKRTMTIDLGAKIASKSSEVQDAVGGAANAAVAFSKLGVQPSLMSWLGDDTVGRRSRRYLQEHGVDMSGVSTKSSARTNYHYVLRYGPERTIISNYEQFDYVWRNPVCQPDWLYLSSISTSARQLHDDLLEYLEQHPAVKFAFQPGASHLQWGAKDLKKLYARADLLIMNLKEAMTVTGRQICNIALLLRQLHQMGAKTVVLTDGAEGAYAFDGTQELAVPSYPDPAKPVDRTGAGDAFAATLVAEFAKGAELKDALLSAPINSMSVVQYVGAQAGLLTTKELNEYLDKASDEYAVRVR